MIKPCEALPSPPLVYILISLSLKWVEIRTAIQASIYSTTSKSSLESRHFRLQKHRHDIRLLSNFTALLQNLLNHPEAIES